MHIGYLEGKWILRKDIIDVHATSFSQTGLVCSTLACRCCSVSHHRNDHTINYLLKGLNVENNLKQEHWVTRMMLFPGEWICDQFKMKNDDNRMLVRMYHNLVVYAKIFGTLAYIYTT